MTTFNYDYFDISLLLITVVIAVLWSIVNRESLENIKYNINLLIIGFVSLLVSSLFSSFSELNLLSKEYIIDYILLKDVRSDHLFHKWRLGSFLLIICGFVFSLVVLFLGSKKENKNQKHA